MIKLTPTNLADTSTSYYGLEILECINPGYDWMTTPSASVSVSVNGSPVTAGSVTYQNLLLVATLTYQPDGSSSMTRTRVYSESVDVALPGSVSTITPTIGSSVKIVPKKTGCCGRVKGVKMLTSLQVAYSA